MALLNTVYYYCYYHKPSTARDKTSRQRNYTHFVMIHGPLSAPLWYWVQTTSLAKLFFPFLFSPNKFQFLIAIFRISKKNAFQRNRQPSQWCNRQGGWDGGTLLTRKFQLTYWEKRGKEKREKGEWRRKGGKLKMEGGKVTKWEDFFFSFSLFKPLKFVLGLPKWKFLPRKSISRWKKSGKINLPPQKHFPAMPLNQA